ncbi:MAG: 4a-hydroxytetrahydrobiopterin dehydratase [Frankiaceae bacterium]|nr:4a-hydroxytetrahydrobiopterin dehydratase [Frankiaceae bacterium]
MTETLTRTAASAALEGTAWRYLLGTIVTSVDVHSVLQAAQVAQAVVDACAADADGHLRIDLRPSRVELSLQTAAVAGLTVTDVELARRIDAAVAALGLTTTGVQTDGDRRSVQMLEIAIDALDIAAIRPFWKAVMGYADEPGRDGPTDAVVDPAWQGPAIWFQQMTEPRPQRNRIHFDITVPHDEADARVRAALTAGGSLVSDDAARSFWILADAEGNEICVCTWQDREGPQPSDD